MPSAAGVFPVPLLDCFFSQMSCVQGLLLQELSLQTESLAIAASMGGESETDP